MELCSCTVVSHGHKGLVYGQPWFMTLSNHGVGKVIKKLWMAILQNMVDLLDFPWLYEHERLC